jgi:Fe-Mn family superoxide dismutase
MLAPHRASHWCQLITDLCLPDDYGALEPAISGKIMELHHKNHHQTYVNSYNAASEQLQDAESKQDIAAAIALQPLINFHGGGHLNHSLFWENLAPMNQGGGGEPEGKLKVRIASPTYHIIRVLITLCRQQ